MDEDDAAIVCDAGSNTVKAGFSGDSAPYKVFPTAVGRPRPDTASLLNKDYFFGDEAVAKQDLLKITKTIEHGVVTSWDCMEKIWRHTFQEELRVNPEEHAVLLTEASLGPKAGREKITQIMFETFATPAMYVAQQMVLSMYASGRTTGITLDIGEGVSHIMPVYDGYALWHGQNRLDLGGCDLTDFLMKLIHEKRPDLRGTVDMHWRCYRQCIRDAKEKLCYVALDYNAELAAAASVNVAELSQPDLQKTYKLPDGNSFTIGQERFQVPEMFFQPKLGGRELKEDVPDVLLWSIERCDADIRKDLYANVVICGGCTLFHQFDKRLLKELKAVAPVSMRPDVKVIAPPERRYQAWIGGSILTSLSTFEDMWIQKEEYDEFGPGIVHRKCF